MLMGDFSNFSDQDPVAITLHIPGDPNHEDVTYGKRIGNTDLLYVPLQAFKSIARSMIAEKRHERNVQAALRLMLN